MKIKALILAAGQGTRMKSNQSKVLHKVLDKTLVDYPILAAKQVGVKEICMIIGHKAEEVKNAFGNCMSYVLQEQQLGTGHAVMQAIDFIEDEGQILILYGDTPLITAQTLEKMIGFHKQSKNAATVLSAIVDEPTGYGRIIRDKSGAFIKIVEQKDASSLEQEVQEINGGMYVFEAGLLKYALSKLNNNNAQKEYYLTDTIEILLAAGHRVDAIAAEDANDILGVNSREQLAEVTEILKRRIHVKHMRNGVSIIDPQATYIGTDVKIGQDTVIEPGCIIEGNTQIGEGCRIGYHSKIKNSIIRNDVDIEISVITESFIDEAAHIGPFAYLRPHSHIGKHTKVGDFVEIKNAKIGDGTKISHLTYIGDADIGQNVNFGCGTVIVNYDGENKHRTTVKDNAFIGCNTNLVSPVIIEEGAYTAAGSTITKNVPKNSLAISRVKQENKLEWVTKKRKK